MIYVSRIICDLMETLRMRSNSDTTAEQQRASSYVLIVLLDQCHSTNARLDLYQI